MLEKINVASTYKFKKKSKIFNEMVFDVGYLIL